MFGIFVESIPVRYVCQDKIFGISKSFVSLNCVLAIYCVAPDDSFSSV